MKNIRKFRPGEAASSKWSEERDEFERDYARLIQSPTFRRLQGKSQVFGAGSGDYYRTRLTHSLRGCTDCEGSSEAFRADESFFEKNRASRIYD